MKNKFLRFFFVSIVFSSTACVSIQQTKVPQDWLASTDRKMQRACKLSSRSGFSADIALNNAAISRVEAIWDDVGRFSGQLINTLGEDFLSFQIDEFGQFNTTQAIDKNNSLFQALELLARIGSLQTRYLLCSGLYLSGSDDDAAPFTELSSVRKRTLTTSHATLHLLSSMSPDVSNAERVMVKSRVTTHGWIFRKSVAEIDWLGKLEREVIHPISLTISSDIASIKFLFLDFD